MRTPWLRAAAIGAAMLAVVPIAGVAGRAAAAGSVVAVVDFYALSPLSPLVAAPELLAADDLANLVANSGGGRMTVIPRASVRQAESSIGWQPSDVLRFGRLRELARALDANLLVVGWFERLELDRGNGSGLHQRSGNGMVTGFATITVQIFDPRQGRIVFQVERSAFEDGIVSARVGERLIRRVVEGTVPSIMPAIGGGS